MLEGSVMSNGCTDFMTDLRVAVAGRSSASRNRVPLPLDTIRECKRARSLHVYRRGARRADKDSDRNNFQSYSAERKGKRPTRARRPTLALYRRSSLGSVTNRHATYPPLNPTGVFCYANSHVVH